MKRKKKVLVEIRTTTQHTDLFEIDEDTFEKEECDGEVVYEKGKWKRTTKPTTYLYNIVSWKEEQ